MPNVKKPKITEVKSNAQWGLYMWRLPNGKLFRDEEGNYLNIPSIKNDLEKIANIRQAAAYYGEPLGEPHFEPGVERATDEEYAEQVDRLKHGEILLNDNALVAEEQRAIREGRRNN